MIHFPSPHHPLPYYSVPHPAQQQQQQQQQQQHQTICLSSPPSHPAPNPHAPARRMDYTPEAFHGHNNSMSGYFHGHHQGPAVTELTLLQHHHAQQQLARENVNELCIPPTLLGHYPPASPTSLTTTSSSSSSQESPATRESYLPNMMGNLKRSTSPEDDLDMPEETQPMKKCSRNERGERISSKDFIPPDTTGLSKREARLVKNRAAAFLSRQRKREEFEALEVRVQELEAENAQLRAGGSPPKSTSASTSSNESDLRAEITRLRNELSTSARRCSALEKDLTRVRQTSLSPVKSEPIDDSDMSSTASTSPRNLNLSIGIPPAPGSVTSSEDDESKPPSTPTKDRDRTSGVMMALLLLLAPVLSPSSTPLNTPAFEEFVPPKFDFGLGLGSMGMFDQNLSAPLLPQHHPDIVDGGNWFEDTLSSATTQFFPPTPATPQSTKRSVELDVQLSRDPSNPDRVRVKIVDPTPSFGGSGIKTDPYTLDAFSSLALHSAGIQTPPPTAVSDFLTASPYLSTEFDAPLPSEYSLSTLSTGEKKRVRLSVGPTGEWEVEVR